MLTPDWWSEALVVEALCDKQTAMLSYVLWVNVLENTKVALVKHVFQPFQEGTRVFVRAFGEVTPSLAHHKPSFRFLVALKPSRSVLYHTGGASAQEHFLLRLCMSQMDSHRLLDSCSFTSAFLCCKVPLWILQGVVTAVGRPTTGWYSVKFRNGGVKNVRQTDLQEVAIAESSKRPVDSKDFKPPAIVKPEVLPHPKMIWRCELFS